MDDAGGPHGPRDLVRATTGEWGQVSGVPPSALSIAELTDEMIAARRKFPDPTGLLTALLEEAGELAQAILQKRPLSDICGEALQVACVAMRLYEEGDPLYAHLPDSQAKP